MEIDLLHFLHYYTLDEKKKLEAVRQLTIILAVI
jgi:hypothetical protein